MKPVVLALLCCLVATASDQANLTGLAVNGSGLYAWLVRPTGIFDLRPLLGLGDPEVFSIAHDGWNAYVVVNGNSLERVNTGNGQITSVGFIPGTVLSAAVCDGVYTAIIADSNGVSFWAASGSLTPIPGATSASVGLSACDSTGQYWTYLELASSSGLYSINPGTGLPTRKTSPAQPLLALVGAGAGSVLLVEEPNNHSINISNLSNSGQITGTTGLRLDAGAGFAYSLAGRAGESDGNGLLFAVEFPDSPTLLMPANIEFPASLELLSLYSVPTSSPPTSTQPNPSPSPPSSVAPSYSITGGYSGNSLPGFVWTNPTVLTYQGVVTLSGDLVVNLPADFQLEGNTLLLFSFSDGTTITGSFSSVTVNDLASSFCEPPTLEYRASSIYLLFSGGTDCTSASSGFALL